MKTIAISGASGFVGTSLKGFFQEKGFSVIAISRSFLDDKKKLQEIISKTDIVINLAGANIINRWSESYKKVLYSSRIDTTNKIVEAINSCENKPKLLISTSAVGIYDNEKCHDERPHFANDFLSKLCQEWEHSANKADTKVAIFRFGIVLGKNGGALQKMLTPFKLGLGGIIGSGRQAFSYIHIEDLLRAYDFVIKKELDGIFNLTTPYPTTNYGLTKALGKALKKPTFFPVPAFILQLIFSEGAKVLTDGQEVVPQRLLEEGFEFKFKEIDETIENLV